MSKFISVIEGRSCRYDSSITPEDIVGLYTDNFSECNIIIIFKKYADNIKISMIHFGRLNNHGIIAAELEWIGSNHQILILLKPGQRGNEIYDLYKQYLVENSLNHPIQHLGDHIFGTAVELNQAQELVYMFYDKGQINSWPELYTHPEEWKLQSFYTINRYTKTEPLQPLNSCTLLFDGQNWATDLGNDDKCLIQEKLLDDASKIYKPCFVNVLVGHIIRLNLLQIQDSVVIAGMIALAMIRLMINNNYKQIFINELTNRLTLGKWDNGTKISDNERSLIADIMHNSVISTVEYDNFKSMINNGTFISNACKKSIIPFYGLCMRMQHHTNKPPIAAQSNTSSAVQSIMTAGGGVLVVTHASAAGTIPSAAAGTSIPSTPAGSKPSASPF